MYNVKFYIEMKKLKFLNVCLPNAKLWNCFLLCNKINENIEFYKKKLQKIVTIKMLQTYFKFYLINLKSNVNNLHLPCLYIYISI